MPNNSQYTKQKTDTMQHFYTFITANFSSNFITQKIIFALFILTFSSNSAIYAQGTSCATAEPFCTDSGADFPAGVNNGNFADAGNNYDCLISQPNAAWYYLEIDNGGNLIVDLSSSPLEDIDFIVWGPFNNLTDAQNNCGSLGVFPFSDVVDCSFSTATTETATINGAVAGEVYIFMVTNFSNAPTDITLQSSGASTATTDCTIVAPPPPPTAPNCGEIFTDSGGSGGSYSLNENTTWQICPTTPGDVVTLTFTSFDVEEGPGFPFGPDCYDFMNVYNGTSAAATQIGGDYCGVTNPGPFTSTDASGCLFVTFSSDASIIGAGWEADVTCDQPCTAPNDECTTAESLTQTESCTPIAGTVECATDSGIPAPVCDGFVGVANDDVWYSFVAQSAFPTIEVDANFDGVIELFEGPCNSLTGLDCGDTPETINAGPLNPGTTYYVRVYSYNSGTPVDPTFTICVYEEQDDCGQSNTQGQVITCDNCTAVTGTAPGSLGGNQNLTVNANDCGPVTIVVEYSFDWNQGSNINWIHGVSFDAGPNWTASQASAPAGWVFVDGGVTGQCSGNDFGSGFFFEGFNNGSDSGDATSAIGGVGPCDCTIGVGEASGTDPSDNWGLDCSGGDCPTFQFELTFCPPFAGQQTFTENISFTVSEDGNSGGWCIDGGCTISNDFTVTINSACGENPDFDFDDFCAGDTNGPSNVSSPGGTFAINPPVAGISIDPSTGVVSGESCGDMFTVEYSTPGTCVVASSTVDVTVFDCCSNTTLQACDDGDPCTENDMESIDNCGGGVCVPCAGTPITPTDPTFSVTDTYCQGDPVDALPTTSDNGITGTWSPTTIDDMNSGSYTFTPNGTECANPFTLNVTINSPADPTFSITDTYCAGDATDALPTTSDNGINGTWSPASIDNTTSGTYTFTPNGGSCANPFTLNVTIDTPTDPTFSITDTYCAGDAVDALPSSSDNGITGSWSPTTIDNMNSGSYTFTPAGGQCANPFTLNVTINTPDDPTFSITDTYCAGDAVDALPTTSDNGITGTWSPSAIDNMNSGSYTFTPAGGQCANPFTLNVTINTPDDPTFSITDTYCAGDAVDALPSSSDNGITGSWSPTTIDNMNSGSYTFTPAGGQCANPFTLNVTINTPDDPTFSITDTYCAGDAVDALPSSSNNGITGSWSPTTIDNMNSGSYTFTPAGGQCANPFTLNVTINTPTDPTFSITDTYCAGDAVDALPTTSDNGITGTWSPSAIDNMNSGSYTFTPAGGQCANPFTLNVTINTPTDPTFSITDTYCVDDTGDALPTTSDNGITGTWSPSTISTTSAGNSSYTFTPTAGCFNPFILSVTVNDCGCMDPTMVTASGDFSICEGETADLSATLGGSATTMTWSTAGDGSFDNTSSATPVYTPGAGDIAAGSVVVTVTTDDPDGAGPCTAISDDVVITIDTPTDPTFTLNNNYCQGDATDALPTTSDNGINGTWSPATIDNMTGGDYVFTPTAGQCANPFTLTVTIDTPTDPTFSITDTYCPGDATDGLPTNSDNGIAGTWSPATIDNMNSGTYTFTPNGGQCANNFVLNVTISSSVDPTFSVNDTYCAGDATDALPTTSDNGVTGTWSPTTIDNMTSGSYTFTPTAGCANPFTLNVTINPSVDPTFTITDTYCQGDATDALPTTSDNGVTGTWSPTSINNNASGSYTFTPTAGGCATNFVLSVTINPVNVPSFSITDTYCEGDATDALPTTADNGITGTWSPTTIDNTTSGTYTFTADGGQCADDFTLNVTINPPANPTFSITDTYCAGDATDALPTNSNNGVVGTWSPTTIDNMTSGSYVFTPNTGQCANDFTLNVTINPATDPTFTITDNYCQGDATDALPTTSDNGVMGTWSPATIDNNAGGSYTFTPSGAQCANDFTLNVTINPPTNPTFTITDTYCEGDATDALPTTSDNGVMGTWSPTTIDNTTSGTYTFTATGCANDFTLNVTINPNMDPTFTINDTYCEGDAVDALPTTSNNGITGTWSPTTIDNTTSGTYTFSPAGGCANPFTLNVTVNPPTDPTFTITDTYCEGDATDALPTTSDNGIVGTWSPANISNTTSGTYTFTPSGTACANPFTLNVTINPPTVPTFTINDTYCVGDAGDALPTTSDNGVMGTWSPSTISTAGSGNTSYTFTPGAGCFSPFTLTVTVNDCGCMNPTSVTASGDFSICEGETASLSAVLGGSATMTTWSTAGDGTFDNMTNANVVYTPGAGDIGAGSVVVTVVTDDPDGAGPCTATSDDVVITIDAPTDPTFTLNDTYCQGDATDALPTTSDNGLNGSWSPATIDNTTGGSYTFTPNAGQCANPFTLNVTIDTPTNPTFTITDTYCEGETTNGLPNTSDNGINGTWSPTSIDNTTSGSYTFTPNAGQCANDFTLNVTINPPADPTFTITDNYCEGDATDALPTTSDNGFTGTWSPATISNLADGTYTFTPAASECANSFVLNVTIDTPVDPTFTITDNYCQGDATDVLPLTSSNGVAGTWSPTSIDNTADGTYTFTPDATECANNFTLNVTIDTPTDPTFNITDTYCAGDAVDALPTTSDNGFTGSWSPANIDNTTSGTYTFTSDAGQCAGTFTLNVTIDTPVDPTFTINDDYCVGDAGDALPTTSDNGITGTWTPSSITTASAGNNSYTFTPDAGCFNSFTLSVTVNDCGCMNPATVMAASDFSICEGATADLSATIGGSATTMTWSTAGDGSFDNTTIMNPVYTPGFNDNNNGTIIVTVTTDDPDGAGPCSAVSDDIVITLDAPVASNFTLTDTYCQGDATDALPTVSDNGINGTWSPATVNNTTSGSYTFTPDNGECADPFTFMVTIDLPTDPTFTITDTYCQGAITDVLPTNSDNGIAGVWSPSAIDNTTNGSYTFTPNAGQCANNFILNVVINQPVQPTFTVTNNYCQGATTDALPLTSDNGINGTWSPSSIDNNADGTYTFTPDAGQCATDFMLSVTIDTPTNPTFTITDTYCQGAATNALPTVSNNGINGTWSPSVIDNNADGTYIFTPDAGLCANTFTLNVTITTPTDPTFVITDNYCEGDAVDNLPTISDNGINGTWSPSAINNLASGTYTFTPDAAACANSFVLNVTIDAPTDPTFNITDTYCVGDAGDALPTTSDNGVTGTWSPSSISTAGAGNSSYTFTPSSGCFNSFTLSVTVNDCGCVDPAMVAANDDLTICAGETADLSATLSGSASTMIWTTAGSGSFDNIGGAMPVYTPSANDIANGSVIVTVTTDDPDGNGPCSPASDDVVITINTPTEPTFTLNNAYCQGDVTDALPLASDNGVTGTWSPTVIDNQMSGTYTFTPDAGQCANDFNLNVIIDTPVDPVFNITDNYCQGDAADGLPNISDDGISGNWSPPVIDNTADGTYTFTPDAGQCANDFTLNVTVDIPVDPIFNITDNYCQGDTPNALPTISNNGINGTWSPSSINTSVDGTYTFTPNPGECGNSFMIDVTIETPTEPTFSFTDSYCEGDDVDDLPTTSDNGVNGTWSPSAINPNASGTYIFTPANGECANTFIIDVFIEDPTDPVFTLMDVYCIDDMAEALPTTSDNGITGSWFPSSISTATAGTTTYAFISDAGCFNDFTLPVTVNDCGCADPATVAVNDDFEICEGETADLMATLGGSATMVTWSTAGDGTFDDDTSLSPVYTPGANDIANGLVTISVITDDPDGNGPCSTSSNDVIVTIQTPTNPTFTITDSYCQGDTPDALPVLSDNGIGGSWAPSTISTAADGTYIFTPANGECANTFILDIFIEMPTDPTFTLDDTYCIDDAPQGLPTTSDNGITGTWSPSTISTTTAGNTTYTFTPDAGCFNEFAISITVNDCGCMNPATVMASDDFGICEGATADLTATLGGSATTTTWTTAGDGTFDDDANATPVYTPGANDIANGSVTVTVTTDDPDGNGPCSSSSDDVVISIDQPVTPTFALMDTYCIDDVAETLPLTSDNGITGTWSPNTISTSATGNTDYTFTPDGGTCADAFILTVTVNNCGCANPPTVMTGGDVTICEGETANLSSTIGGGATTQTWTTAGDGAFDDNATANPVYTPSANDITNGSVIVTVTTDDPDGNGPCQAATADVLITIQPLGTPTFALTDAYCEGAITDALPTTSDNGIMGTWSPSTIDNTASGTYTFTPDGGCANDFTLNVTVNPVITPIFTVTDNYCEGAMTDALPTTSDNGVTGTWAPSTINNMTSGAYTFTPDGGDCANGFTLNVTIDAPTDPMFVITDTYCISDMAETLPTTSDNGITGTWSPSTISTTGAGSTSYTFTPDTGCFNSFVLSVTIEDCDCMNPATVMAIDNFEICADASADLSATLGGSATTMTWTTAGDGTFDDDTSATPVYTPGANDIANGSVIVTVITDDPDGNGPCSASSDDVVITINAPTQPTFTLTDTYCAGNATDALPVTSENGINGTWSPNTIDNTADGVYTFTPDAGSCANAFTLNVTVTAPTDPIFSINDDYCEGAMTDALPTTSDNGITGTWSPSTIDNMNNGTYTFTPDGCANPFVLNVSIGNPVDPTFTLTDNYCQGDMTDALPMTSDNGVDGTWSPSTINNMASGTYTFTPDGCANTFTLNVTIDLPTDPTFTIEDTYCIDDTADALPMMSDNGITGTWSPATISTTNAGSTSYTFTPDAGCFNTFVLSVTIDDCGCMNPAMVTADADFTICANETANLSATLSGSATTTTWTTAGDGTFDDDMSNNPVYTPGANDLANGSVIVIATTNDPDGNGPCSASSDDVVITINALTTPTFTLTDTYCTGAMTDALPTTSNNGVAGTWSPSTIDNTANGTYTFTPVTGACAENFAIDVIILDAPTVSNVVENCDQTGATYTISFTINGGDAATYTVTGGNGTLIGNSFTSDPINDNVAYSFVVDDANGCNPVTVSGQFDCPDCPPVTFDLVTTGDIACFGETNGVAMATNISSATQPITYNWSNGDQIQEAENLAAGWHTVTITDGDGCFGIDSILMTQPDALTAIMVANDSPCFGDSNGSILFDEVLGGTAPFSYSIDGVNFSNQIQYNNLSPGSYEIAVMDANGCMFEENFSIVEPDEVIVNLGLDTIINLGDSILLDPEFNVIVVDSFVWVGVNCINCPDVMVAPNQAMTISLTIETLNGCLGSDALVLGVNTQTQVFLPNIFSPNNDGTNDLFYPYAGSSIKQINEFKIFDRWGELLYQFYDFPPNTPAFGWDGTYRGKLLNPQVCVWYMEVELQNGRKEIVKGDVVIAR